MASGLLLKILLVVWQVRAGTLSCVVDISLRFFSMANWLDEKPCTLFREIFALKHQDTAKSVWYSLMMVLCYTISNLCIRVRLCFSTIPFLQGIFPSNSFYGYV